MNVLTKIALCSLPALGLALPAQDQLQEQHPKRAQLEAEMKSFLKRQQVVRNKLESQERELSELRSLEVRRESDELTHASPGRIGELQARYEDLTVEAAVLTARRDAMEGEMADLYQRVRATLEQDELLALLTESVRTMQQELDDVVALKTRAGAASPVELAEMRWRIVEARLEVENRKQALTQRAGGDLLQSLRMRIIESRIDQRGVEVRRDHIQRRLADDRDTLRSSQEMLRELLGRRVKAEREYEDLREEYNHLTSRLQQLKDLSARDDVRRR